MNIFDKQFLIIVGQPKAGTTSLYHWLSQHPSICASSYKETRFFLDKNYPLPRIETFDEKNLDKYEKFFDHQGREVMMEATPDYMYCEMPLRIKEFIPGTKVVIIKRDPVDRLVSAFLYFKQRGMLDRNIDVEAWIDIQSRIDVVSDTPVQYRVLDQCRDIYRERFEIEYGDNCMTIAFEDLKVKPKKIVEEVCGFCGIDKNIVDSFNFQTFNRTKTPRFVYLAKIFYYVRGRLSYAAKLFPKVRKKILRPIAQGVESIILDDARLDKDNVDKQLIRKKLEKLRDDQEKE